LAWFDYAAFQAAADQPIGWVRLVVRCDDFGWAGRAGLAMVISGTGGRAETPPDLRTRAEATSFEENQPCR
jgi:hypothetical protein